LLPAALHHRTAGAHCSWLSFLAAQHRRASFRDLLDVAEPLVAFIANRAWPGEARRVHVGASIGSACAEGRGRLGGVSDLLDFPGDDDQPALWRELAWRARRDCVG